MSWTIGNRYLTQSEMEGNAQEVYSFLQEEDGQGTL